MVSWHAKMRAMLFIGLSNICCQQQIKIKLSTAVASKNWHFCRKIRSENTSQKDGFWLIREISLTSKSFVWKQSLKNPLKSLIFHIFSAFWYVIYFWHENSNETNFVIFKHNTTMNTKKVEHSRSSFTSDGSFFQKKKIWNIWLRCKNSILCTGRQFFF